MSETTNKPTDGSAVGTMTPEEFQAYNWARNQNYQSVSATYARILANYIKRIAPPPNIKVSDGGPLTPTETQARTRRSLD